MTEVAIGLPPAEDSFEPRIWRYSDEMTTRSDSDSAAQRAAEVRMIDWLSKQLGHPLAKTTLRIGDARVELDGFHDAGNRIVLVEAYARLGELRGAQPKKVLADVLKLVFVRHHLAKTRSDALVDAHYVFASVEAAAILRNGSWGAAAATALASLTVHVAELDSDTLNLVATAQRGQDIRT